MASWATPIGVVIPAEVVVVKLVLLAESRMTTSPATTLPPDLFVSGTMTERPKMLDIVPPQSVAA
jgi:hypothetical protein